MPRTAYVHTSKGSTGRPLSIPCASSPAPPRALCTIWVACVAASAIAPAASVAASATDPAACVAALVAASAALAAALITDFRRAPSLPGPGDLGLDVRLRNGESRRMCDWDHRVGADRLFRRLSRVAQSAPTAKLVSPISLLLITRTVRTCVVLLFVGKAMAKFRGTIILLYPGWVNWWVYTAPRKW